MVTNEEIRNRMVLAISSIMVKTIPSDELYQYASMQFDRITKVYPRLLDAGYYNNKYLNTYRIDAILSDIEYNYMSKYSVYYNESPVLLISDVHLRTIKSEMRSLTAANKGNIVKGR